MNGFLEVLQKLASSTAVQVAGGLIGVGLAGLVFSWLRSILKDLKAKAAKTPTPEDDRLVAAAENAVDALERGVVTKITPKK